MYDPAKKCKDAVVSARQFVTFLMYLRLRRRAFGLLGVITQLRCFRGRAARTCKKHSSEARNVDEKWQKQQDQRAIQSKEINNGSYLVTWVTSCSSPQPLPNLWTSLVRAEPKQSPGAPTASADHHLRTFSPHARCQATGLACRRQALPSGSIAEPTAGGDLY